MRLSLCAAHSARVLEEHDAQNTRTGIDLQGTNIIQEQICFPHSKLR